jgi:hypothetical protein
VVARTALVRNLMDDCMMRFPGVCQGEEFGLLIYTPLTRAIPDCF